MSGDVVARFEACTLPPEEFHHEQHLHGAWSYLREIPLAPAAERFIENLKRYAATVGAPRLYHETITWAYLLLVNERVAEVEGRGSGAGEHEWARFREANGDLFARDCLQRYACVESEVGGRRSEVGGRKANN